MHVLIWPIISLTWIDEHNRNSSGKSDCFNSAINNFTCIKFGFCYIFCSGLKTFLWFCGIHFNSNSSWKISWWSLILYEAFCDKPVRWMVIISVHSLLHFSLAARCSSNNREAPNLSSDFMAIVPVNFWSRSVYFPLHWNILNQNFMPWSQAILASYIGLFSGGTLKICSNVRIVVLHQVMLFAHISKIFLGSVWNTNK